MKKVLEIFGNIINFKFISVLIILFFGSFLFYLNYSKNGTKLDIKEADNSIKIKQLINKGDSLFDVDKNDDAIYFLNKAQQLCNPEINTEDYVYSLSLIANIQQNNSNYIASEDALTKTLPYLKKLKNPKFTYNVYTLIAYNYSSTFDYNNAILYHKKALKLAKTSFKKSVILTDIAILYLEQKKYEKAITILAPLIRKKIKHEKSVIKTDSQYAIQLGNIGYCYFKIGNPKALYCLEKSLKIQLKLKSDYELTGTYTSLSLFHKITNPKLARMYAEKAYRNACKVNSALRKVYNLALLIELSEGNDLKKKSLDYIKLIDSIILGRQKAKNQFSNIKYISKIEKDQNLELKIEKAESDLQLEREKNRNILSYIIISLITIISSFLYFHLKLKGEKEKKKAILESEMRISKKLNDELTDGIFQTLNFAENIDLEKNENKEKLLNNLDMLYSRTRNISKENSSIITDENYSNALKEMISGFKTPDINIILHGFDLVGWNEIEKNKKIVLYRILQELFSNMKKHSFATLVSITFKISDKKMIIFYKDNGTGGNNRALILKNGLQNVESRIKTINGNIIFDHNSEKGFRLNFSFPL